MSDESFTVVARPDESRYVLVRHQDGADDEIVGMEAYADVEVDGHLQRVLYHTEVDEAFGRRGLASDLVQGVVDDLVVSGITLVPVCPYVARWLPRHPDHGADVVPVTPVHLQAVRDRVGD